MKPKILAGALVLFGTMLGGCAAGGVYYVRSGPPAPRYGVVGVAPGAGYVWTNGYWDWNGGRWVWIGGRWAAVPHRHHVWVEPYYHPYHGHYHYHHGYWR